jgi:hypothetical protein
MGAFRDLNDLIRSAEAEIRKGTHASLDRAETLLEYINKAANNDDEETDDDYDENVSNPSMDASDDEGDDEDDDSVDKALRSLRKAGNRGPTT